MEQQIEDIIRCATEVAFATALDLLKDDIEYISERAAKKKYKGQLELWERHGLITPIDTANGKHKVYSKRRLIMLLQMHETRLSSI